MAFSSENENTSNGGGGAEGYSLIPVWDGAPRGWWRYRDDVDIRAPDTNLGVKYCVAARLVPRLNGAARRVGLRIPRGGLAAGSGRGRCP